MCVWVDSIDKIVLWILGFQWIIETCLFAFCFYASHLKWLTLALSNKVDTNWKSQGQGTYVSPPKPKDTIGSSGQAEAPELLHRVLGPLQLLPRLKKIFHVIFLFLLFSSPYPSWAAHSSPRLSSVVPSSEICSDCNRTWSHVECRARRVLEKTNPIHHHTENVHSGSEQSGSGIALLVVKGIEV